MRNTPNEEEPKDNSKVATRKERGCSAETLEWLKENQLAERATIETDSLFEGIGYSCSLPRARFEELCMDYFLAESACETEMSSRRTCMTYCSEQAHQP